VSNQEVFQPVSNWPSELRPRERLLQDGAQSVSDAELLAILLRTGSARRTVLDVARDLLAKAGGLRALAQWHAHEWQQAHGVGPTKAATVLAALELGRRTWNAQQRLEPLDTIEKMYRHVAPRFLGERRETLWIVGLDAKNVAIVEAIVGQGTADRAPAHAREVFAPLLKAGALKGVLCHNHPSGDPEPSPSDHKLTRSLAEAGRLLDLPLIDHIIVGDGRFVSFCERGWL
jgi:DNA repair protein RadC